MEFHNPFGCIPQQPELMKNLGMTWWRLFINWAEVEPRRGEFKFDHCDEIVKLSQIFSITLLPVLTHDVPPWAGSDPKGPPDNPEDFAKFVYKMVERYREYVRQWEIWNEPDIGVFWRGTYEEFARLLVLASTEAKRIDPHCEIISGVNGCAGSPREAFLSVMRQKGVFDHIDGVSIHYYPQQGLPPLPPESWGEALHAHKLATRESDRHLNFWITEWGFSSEKPWGEEDQAKRIFKGIATILGTGIAKKVGYALLKDEPRIADELEEAIKAFSGWQPPEEGAASSAWDEKARNIMKRFFREWAKFGLFREDRSPKPAAESYRLITSALTQRFSNGNHLFLLEFNHPITYYGFSNAKGRVLTLWNEETDLEQEGSVTVSGAPGNSVACYTYLGERTSPKFSQIGDLLKVKGVELSSNDPILLVFT